MGIHRIDGSPLARARSSRKGLVIVGTFSGGDLIHGPKRKNACSFVPCFCLADRCGRPRIRPRSKVIQVMSREDYIHIPYRCT